MASVPLNPPLVRKVGLEERAWASRKAVHKMGWVRPGDIVTLVTQNGDWYQIDPSLSDAPDLDPATAAYPDHWIKDRPDGLFLAVDAEPVDEPVDEPVSDGPSDAELGAAFRLLVDFFWHN